MSYTKPPDYALAKIRWPQTRWGRTVLWTSAVYLVIWLTFWIAPGLKESLLQIPYLGSAIFWFTGLYVFALIVWVLWWLFGP